MKFVLEKSKYLILIAVFTLLTSFVMTLGWGVVTAFKSWVEIVSTQGTSSKISVLIIKHIDVFLIAVVLYMLAASMYELFIGNVNLPSRLVAKNLTDLKVKFSGIIVLVIAGHFVESLFDGQFEPLQLLYRALSVTLVCGMLIAFAAFGHTSKKDKSSGGDAAH